MVLARTLRLPVAVLCGCALLPTCRSVDAEAAALAQLVDARGVEEFWRLQDRLAAGEALDDAAWQPMFATPAYEWLVPDDAARGRVRAIMRTAFQPDLAVAEAEAAQAEGYAAIRWQHYLRMRAMRGELEAHLGELRARPLIAEALAITARHLPAGVVQSAAWRTPVRIALFAPDAYAGDGAVFIDLLKARDMGEGFVLLLAHEFHHEYYAQLSTLPDIDKGDELYWLVHTLKQLHQEGIADQIDKRFPLPKEEHEFPGYAESYNLHYRGARQTLESFDLALVEMARNPGELAERARRAWDLFHFGAHPEGFYMANAIAHAEGQQALLEDVGDPFAFARRFQTVQPVFSPEALAFLREVEARCRADGE